MPPIKMTTTKKSIVISESENSIKTMSMKNTKVLANLTLKKENSKDCGSLKTTTFKKSTENPVKILNTRSAKLLPNSAIRKENFEGSGLYSKRKAISPIKGSLLKRSALVNITNAIETQCDISGKKAIKKVSIVTKQTIATGAKVSLPVSTSGKPTVNLVKPSRASTQADGPKSSMLPPLPKSRLTLPQKLSVIQGTAHKQSMGRINLRSSTSTLAASTDNITGDDEGGIVTARPVTRQSPAVPKKPVAVPVSKCKVTAKPKCMVTTAPNTRRSSGRRSTLNSTDSSLYVSALSDVLDDEVANASLEPELLTEPKINIDKEYANDPYQCATYAYDIFEYLKSREVNFKIEDYMEMQSSLSQHVRAVVIDWMVEIQENFEMNHETLYLGVKLFDSYLSKIKVSRNSLQLVGATAMFIAAKYDERIPPSIEDFLYICDGSCKKKDMTKMEVNILRVVDFKLGFPLSYRFLRRYARCAKIAMPLLTLARFILEYTLMDYAIVSLSDSKIAAAALYLSFKMKKEQEWDETLIYFSGYRVKDFIEIAYLLNNILHQKPRQGLVTVRNKYSHKIFYEVAKVPLVRNGDL